MGLESECGGRANEVGALRQRGAMEAYTSGGQEAGYGNGTEMGTERNISSRHRQCRSMRIGPTEVRLITQ